MFTRTIRTEAASPSEAASTSSTPFSRLVRRVLLLLALAAPLALTPACGDDGEGSGCESDGRTVNGIQGRVVTPSCDTNLSSANVTIMHGDGTVLTATTGADGIFTFSNAELGNRTGFWRVSVEKGPFRTTSPVDVRVADDGTSEFQVIAVSGG